MHIIHVASELSPIAKIGGLGDVVYGLSQALRARGHTVEIILPKYDCIDLSLIQNLEITTPRFLCNQIFNTIWSGTLHNLPIHLIESEHPAALFSRGMIYGCADDIKRFAYFSKVVMEYLFQTRHPVDILHLHDWPTALIPFLKQQLCPHIARTVFTIHNLEHQGISSPEELTSLDISLAPTLYDPTYPHLINFMKAGIEYADHVVTVSPQYKQEILTPMGGKALQPTLRKHQPKLHGILNGIDESYWNPTTDPYLQPNYPSRPIRSKLKLTQVLQGKKQNRSYLSHRLHLLESQGPLVVSVTRLTPQKSPELIFYAMQQVIKQGGQFILLGSSPSPEVAPLLKNLSRHPDMAILLSHDEELAHLIFAAADLFIIPSLFEPCGLTQLIAQRYGTIPLARMTGGLIDTVFDIDTSSKPLKERNGFTFDFPDEAGIDWALNRALNCFHHDKPTWHRLIQNGLNYDWSWKHTVPQYEATYTER